MHQTLSFGFDMLIIDFEMMYQIELSIRMGHEKPHYHIYMSIINNGISIMDDDCFHISICLYGA